MSFRAVNEGKGRMSKSGVIGDSQCWNSERSGNDKNNNNNNSQHQQQPKEWKHPSRTSRNFLDHFPASFASMLLSSYYTHQMGEFIVSLVPMGAKWATIKTSGRKNCSMLVWPHTPFGTARCIDLCNQVTNGSISSQEKLAHNHIVWHKNNNKIWAKLELFGQSHSISGVSGIEPKFILCSSLW